MRAMPHGYTNTTVTDGRVVVKTYLGPDRELRQAREELALRRLAETLPVPTLIDTVPGTSTTGFVEGVPGQQAIAAGADGDVLHACGRLLAELQSVDPRVMFDDAGGDVLVHNDFGPQNIVMDDDHTGVRLLCDWEWVTVGDRDTDLAWAEFIVRFHHQVSVHALAALFEGYGAKPPWERRRAAMIARATAHREFVRRWHGAAGAATWDDRIAAIASWQAG